MDRLDIKILSALSSNGRMTKLQLSDVVGLSATPCWERIKKLEKAGIIRGYHAELDLQKLADVSYLRVEVTLKNYSLSVAKKFEQMIQSIPQIVECEAILGDIDYLLKIMSSGVDDYLQIIESVNGQEQIDFDYKTLSISKIVKVPSQINVEEIYDYFNCDL
ncbi:MAG: Lrp/AsnC family transcriptional regulator [Colwellia sp.]|nr:Lrp/AsnC family transcriptional regulator [Colwellia sp.]